MKRVLAHTLGGLALGVLVAGPVLAQEVIICPGASILPGDPPGAFCPPTARYLGPMMGNAWAPSDTVTANKSDSLSGNSVTVRGALTGAAVGGFNRVDTDEVSGNEILVAGSSGTPASLSTNAVGGFADQGADVRGNRVTVNEYGSVGAIIYGGYADSDGSAISNSVVIDKWSSIFSINAYGGQARSTGNATGNHFETSDSNVVLASVYGGYTLFGIATGNTVSIVNTTSTATGNPIYGGFCGGSYGPLTGLATNNTVEITDSTIRNPGVYGGYGTSGATGNTVIISGTTNFSAGTALIYGGYQTGGIANDSFTDNLLALHNYTGTANVGRVEGFASYEFLISDDSLPLNVVYTDTSSDGQVHFTPTNNVPSGASSTVTVVDLASGQTLTRQKTALLCPDSGFSGTITNNNAAPTQASASYTFRLSQESDCLYAIVKPVLSLNSIGTTADSMDFSVTSNIDTNAYWQVFAGARTCTLSDATGTAGIGGGTGGMTTGTAFTGGQTSLSADTSYTLCFVAGNYSVYSDVWEKPFKTAKTPAPTLSSGTLSSVTAFSASFSINVNMPAAGFWKLISPTLSCPNPDDLGVDPSASGPITSTPSGASNLLQGSTGSTLSPNTAYKLCFAAAGATTYFAGWETTFNTPPSSAPSVSVSPVTSAADGQSASFTVSGAAGLSVRWQLRTGSVCPAPATLSNPGTIPSSGTLSITLPGLSPSTNYVVCISAAGAATEYFVSEPSFRTDDDSSGGGGSGGGGSGGGGGGGGGGGSGGGGTGGGGTTPTQPTFADGDTLAPGGDYTAPAGTPSFCLGNSGSAPVTVRIDNLPYTITPRGPNTCLEIFDSRQGRALILDSGSADISSIVPGALLLEARNGDLVTGNATIRATVDPVCTSTRVTVLEGKVSAPAWITSPMPAAGCPADALTPEKSQFAVGDGKLSCPPSGLSLKGTWARLTLKHTQDLGEGQQIYVVALYPPAGWFQNNPNGWASLDDPFLPLDTAKTPGRKTTTLVDKLDIRAILGTELYTGDGTDADEMMLNHRYCGLFRVAP